MLTYSKALVWFFSNLQFLVGVFSKTLILDCAVSPPK